MTFDHPAGAPRADIRLTRRDLIRLEPVLLDILSRVLDFSSAGISFPRSGAASARAVHEPDEDRLVLPLHQEGELLAVVTARGARLPGFMDLDTLERLAGLCLETLYWHKAASCDPLTGLAGEHGFLATLTRAVELVQSSLLPEKQPGFDPDLATGFGRFGLLRMRLDHFAWIGETHGYTFAEETLARAARLVRDTAPEAAVCGRLGGEDLGLLMPEASRPACLDLAEKLRAALAAREFEVPGTRENVRPTASFGVAMHPVDLSGRHLKLEAAEQARILAARAAKALETARSLGQGRVFAYNRIVPDGGLVLETLPLDRVGVSLGRSVDAREGQRFLVWAPARTSPGADSRAVTPPTLYKAEIILTSVLGDASLAEIIAVHDPASPVAPGDRLSLVRDHPLETGAQAAPRPGQKDMLTGLYGYRDFMAFLAGQGYRRENFTLVLARLVDAPPSPDGDFQERSEQHVKDTARLLADHLGQEATGGRTGVAGLAFHLPETAPERLVPVLQRVARTAAEEHGILLAVGLAGFPCLDMESTETLANARKALEHALLLDEPKVAAFDSVSLNISADRLFTDGDVFAAMQEYKRSLLADPANTLSRNSLGACLARLGRLEEARRQFAEALEQDPRNLPAAYNLGCACLKLGLDEEARRAFAACLDLAPDHVFSLLRLGQLAERGDDTDQAMDCYRRAAARAEGAGPAMRHMARLHLGANQTDLARECLQGSIRHNPQDHQAIHLLAGLYLESGDDLEIAENLARHGAELRPEKSEYWHLLARTLQAQGRDEEARAVLDRAGQRR